MRTDTPEHLCPCCGYLFVATTCLEGEPIPHPETAVSLCINCGEMLFFNPDLTTRIGTEQEVLRVMSDPKVASLLQRAQAEIRRRGLIPVKEEKNQ